MGRFLCFGIAKTIVVKKERETKEEILRKLERTIDLNIYKEPLENEICIFLELKNEYIEKYAIEFIKEQLEIFAEKTREKEECKNFIENLKNKNYDELIELAKEKKYIEFQLTEGSIYSNDISYIADDLTIFADIIAYLFDGKILMESYNDTFRYIRNLIIRNSDNPIKTSAVISITG